jgi:hypothetical protein
MGSLVLRPKRHCYQCGSGITRLRTSKEGWQWEEWCFRLGRDKPLCRTCAKRLIYSPLHRKRLHQTQHYKEYTAARGRRYIRYAGKTLCLSFRELTGFCSQCPNNIHDRSCKKTDMHHALGYFATLPWFGRVELCTKCHNRTKPKWGGG